MQQQSKKDLRREMKVVLANLDRRWLARAHTEVCDQLIGLMARLRERPDAVRHVLAWIPCFPGEVDLSAFIGTMLRDSVVYLPQLDDGGVMTFVRIFEDWGARLVAGPRGIIQPMYQQPELFFPPPREEDVVVVVPGLAFDRAGMRLGRGAGHYDRFLSHPELSHAVKVGVCWSMQISPAVPIDSQDISMDWLCHERGVEQIAT